MKINKKLIVPFFASVTGLSIAGGINSIAKLEPDLSEHQQPILVYYKLVIWELVELNGVEITSYKTQI